MISGLVKAVGERVTGRYEVDLWGGDRDWVSSVSALTKPFVRVRVDGWEHLPDGPALLISNRRTGVGEAVALSVAVHRATGRMLRPVGVPDLAPVGPVLRRLGGIPESPAEIRSLLVAGHLVWIPLSGQWRMGRAGSVAPELVAPAVDTGCPVLPVAVVGGELTGSWRVAIGPALPAVTGVRRGPLVSAELADRSRAEVQGLLDDAFPPRWSLG